MTRERVGRGTLFPFDAIFYCHDVVCRYGALFLLFYSRAILSHDAHSLIENFSGNSRNSFGCRPQFLIERSDYFQFISFHDFPGQFSC